MSVASVGFLGFVLFGSALFFSLPGVAARQAALALAAAAFLATQLPNLASLVTLAVFLASGYIVAVLLARRPSTPWFAAYLALLLAAFLLLKKYEFLAYVLPAPWFAHPIAVVGLSYILFRQIHCIVDAMQGQIDELSPWVYLHYQLNPFTLLSGPIQRYQEFHAQFSRLTPVPADLAALVAVYRRLFTGLLKLAAVAPALLALHDASVAALTAADGRLGALAGFAGVFYAYPAYIYFNFSGYCDVVIAAAALFGLGLPENFDRPYLARNMIDYWNRWHRTLSFWIRDYVFTPLYKAIAERWPKRAPSLAFLCFFVALFLAGVWHGSRMNWVVFGLLNGLGVSAAKLWENRLVKRRGRPGLRAYLANRPILIAAIVANAHFACFTMLFFKEDLEQTTRLLATFTARLLGR